MSSTTGHKRTASSPPTASAQSQPKISKFFERQPEKPMAPDTPSKDQPSPSPEASTPPKKTPSASPQPPDRITLTYNTGDIFTAPPEALLMHACNTQGSWGAGIALAFRQRYPEAYKRYRAHCLSTHNPKSNAVPTGTCLLIPPCEKDPRKPRHWIGCLFTSANYGKAKDKPGVILANTGPAVKECLREFSGKGEIRMCKINSARFGVPWERTVGVLEGVEVEGGVGIEVWSIE